MLDLFRINVSAGKLTESLLLEAPFGVPTLKHFASNITSKIKNLDQSFKPLDNWVDSMKLEEILQPDNGFMKIISDDQDYFNVFDSRENFFKIYNAYVDNDLSERDVERIKDLDKRGLHILSNNAITTKYDGETISNLYKEYINAIDSENPEGTVKELANKVLKTGKFDNLLSRELNQGENNYKYTKKSKKDLQKELARMTNSKSDLSELETILKSTYSNNKQGIDKLIDIANKVSDEITPKN